VDIPALNPSFCSQNSSMLRKFACPGTKACPQLSKESKGYFLRQGVMPQLKCDLEIGKHALISPPRTALEEFANNFLRGLAEVNL